MISRSIVLLRKKHPPHVDISATLWVETRNALVLYSGSSLNTRYHLLVPARRRSTVQYVVLRNPRKLYRTRASRRSPLTAGFLELSNFCRRVVCAAALYRSSFVVLRYSDREPPTDQRQCLHAQPGNESRSEMTSPYGSEGVHMHGTSPAIVCCRWLTGG